MFRVWENEVARSIAVCTRTPQAYIQIRAGEGFGRVLFAPLVGQLTRFASLRASQGEVHTHAPVCVDARQPRKALRGSVRSFRF